MAFTAWDELIDAVASTTPTDLTEQARAIVGPASTRLFLPFRDLTPWPSPNRWSSMWHP